MEPVEEKKRLPKWVVNLFSWCLPALVLLGAFIGILSPVLDRSMISTLCLLLLIGLIVTRLIFLFRSRRAVGAKIWRAAVWTVLLMALIFLLPFFPLKLHRSIQEDAQSRFEASVSEVFPGYLSEPLELGPVKSVEYHMYLESVAFWTNRSYTLLCRYDPSDYDGAKAALETRYSFRTEPLDAGYVPRGQKAVQIEPYARIGDDCFRFLLPADEDDQDGWDAFYKRCLMVMTNDAEHEIGFIVFQDLDLDEAEDLAEFLNLWCGWKYIR